jgi:hypothetical protein
MLTVSLYHHKSIKLTAFGYIAKPYSYASIVEAKQGQSKDIALSSHIERDQ